MNLTPQSEAYRQVIVTENRSASVSGLSNVVNRPWTGNNGLEGSKRFEITVLLEPLAGSSALLSIDVLKDMECRYTSPAGTASVRPIRPDLFFLMAWLHDAGVDTSKPSVKHEAEVLLNLIDTSAGQGWIGTAWHGNESKPAGRLASIAQNQQWEQRATYPFTRHVGSESSQFGPPFSILLLGLPLSLLLWGGGGYWIVRRSRNWGRSSSTDPAPIAGSDGTSITGQAPTLSRTLTVMFTDIKDYTARSAAQSRAGIVEIIRRHRDVVEPVAKGHGGRIVKTMGDGLLLVFESATDAVRSGVEIQRAVESHNLTSDHDRFELRIGVSTGEVTIEQADVYGHPVNVASRVQQLGAPGQVLFTEATLAMVNRQEVAFDELGRFELKGIDTPIHVFLAHDRHP